MKLSKPLLLIAPILFIFFSSGCSKNLSKPDYTELNDPKPDSEVITESRIITEPEIVTEPEIIREEDVGEFDTPPGPQDSGEKESDLLSEGGDEEKTPDKVEPFLLEKEEDIVGSLPEDEEASQRLPFRSSDQLRDMFFAFDMYDLDDQLLEALQKNATYLKAHPLSKIEIQGHCDERGSNNYNISLGEQRADSVKSYLVILGVEESRIHTVSYGEENPFCFEENEKCWYQNRRARILISE